MKKAQCSSWKSPITSDLIIAVGGYALQIAGAMRERSPAGA